MINIFAIKYEKDGTPTPDGARFIHKQIDERQSAMIDEFDVKIKAVNAKVKLPLWLQIVYYAMIFLSIAFVLGVIGGLQEMSLEAAYQSTPWLFISLPITLLTWLGIALYKHIRTKRVTQGDEVKQLQAEAEQIIDDSKRLLGTPLDAPKIDTLHYFYEQKDGKIRLKRGLGSQYFNIEMQMYSDDDNLYLADLTRVFSFKKDSLKHLQEINETITMDIWNKKESAQSSTYAKYHIKSNSTGAIYVRPFYQLTLEVNQQEYSIFFPSYELETLKRMTGLTPIDVSTTRE